LPIFSPVNQYLCKYFFVLFLLGGILKAMQVTREKILAYLQDHPPSSAGEISRYLEMTPANIRYHLQILTDQGYVNISNRRPTGGAGRPISLYTLTPFSQGDSLKVLLRGILSQLETTESREETLQQIAEKLIKDDGEKRSFRIQRFNEGIERLNAMQYHASWEARPQGPQVELRHCPYQDLAQDHPILCQLDEKFLRLIFGINLDLIQRRDFGKNPSPPCIFR
jgi:predicted ArsR family transcriptional regulator